MQNKKQRGEPETSVEGGMGGEEEGSYLANASVIPNCNHDAELSWWWC